MILDMYVLGDGHNDLIPLASGNHNHAIITREMACYILDYQIGNTYE
jgi:hypothetical protein